MTLVRHFTATAFVVHEDSIALHWHPKVRAWLPPGGHVEPNEDPVQAALREVGEETGLRAAIVPTGEVIELDYPTQVQPPYTIMIEDIDDPAQGFHHHIDMIYFCNLSEPPGALMDGWRWVTRGELAGGAALARPDGAPERPPEDVRTLGLHALRVVGEAERSRQSV